MLGSLLLLPQQGHLSAQLSSRPGLTFLLKGDETHFQTVSKKNEHLESWYCLFEIIILFFGHKTTRHKDTAKTSKYRVYS